MLDNIKVLFHQGKQFIHDVKNVEVPGIFRGRPVISNEVVDTNKFEDICPSGALMTNPVRIDLGKCFFCGQCAINFPSKISFTKDYKTSSNIRENLIITEGIDKPIKFNRNAIRDEVKTIFHNSIKLRQISAGGDNSCEWELNASTNVNFDIGRFGIEFVASPRHADGIVITGPLTENMIEAVKICYDATPLPKIIILVGTDAISGGIFKNSIAVNRSFVEKYFIDLYIPGNPAHPLTIINGILNLIDR